MKTILVSKVQFDKNKEYFTELSGHGSRKLIREGSPTVKDGGKWKPSRYNTDI